MVQYYRYAPASRASVRYRAVECATRACMVAPWRGALPRLLLLLVPGAGALPLLGGERRGDHISLSLHDEGKG